jgi:CBS domain-containing protein
MLAREIMNAPVTVRQSATLAEAAEVLLSQHISSASVVDDCDRLVGIVSDIDLISCQIVPDPRGHLRGVASEVAAVRRVVDEVMTRDVLAMTPSVDVADVVAAMLAQHVPTVPIVEGDQVVGVVSRSEILRLLHRADIPAPEVVRP